MPLKARIIVKISHNEITSLSHRQASTEVMNGVPLTMTKKTLKGIYSIVIAYIRKPGAPKRHLMNRLTLYLDLSYLNWLPLEQQISIADTMIL